MAAPSDHQCVLTFKGRHRDPRMTQKNTSKKITQEVICTEENRTPILSSPLWLLTSDHFGVTRGVHCFSVSCNPNGSAVEAAGRSACSAPQLLPLSAAAELPRRRSRRLSLDVQCGKGSPKGGGPGVFLL